MANYNNPWMALEAYQEKDEYKFKGRDKDTTNLLTMIQQNECVVCYAASGDGKSSLINAGVCPQMRKSGLFPIKIIFTTAEYEGEGLPLLSKGGKIDFDSLILRKIQQGIDAYETSFSNTHNIERSDYEVVFEKSEKYHLTDTPSSISNNLWWKLRTETIQIPFGEYDYIPVLIFDQFEELFRAKWKAEFFSWLEMLMKDVCPSEVANALEKNNIEIPSRKLFKAIFSMRYEYVGELDYWCSQRTYIPQMMHNRYFLKPLTRKDAIDIINSQDLSDPNSKKLSDHSEEIVNNICKDNVDEISPIILSMLCHGLYEKCNIDENFSISQNIIDQTISAFYEDTLAEIKCKDTGAPIPKRDIKAIEDVLVDDNGHRLRLPVITEDLKKIHFSDKYYEPLKDAHLIRSYEINNDCYIELIHDRIAEVIVAKRTKEEIRNKKLFNWALLGVIALAIIVCGLFLIFNSSETNTSEDANYTLVFKAEQDSYITDNDHWKVHLVINNMHDQLIKDTILERGKTEDVSFPFTKKEIDSIHQVKILIKPYSTLYKAKETTIELLTKDFSIENTLTITLPIEKNKEETITIHGKVSANLPDTVYLHHVWIAMGEYSTYTDKNGEFNLSVPRGTQLKTIYAIKEGFYPNYQSASENMNNNISMVRDSTYRFEDRWKSFDKLWVIAALGNRDTIIKKYEESILNIYHIKDKRDLRRNYESNSTNYIDKYKYIYYDYALQKPNHVNKQSIGETIKSIWNNKQIWNDIENDSTVRVFIGSDIKNHYLLEGTMRMIDPDSSKWEVEVIALDSLFNTRDMKGTVIKTENGSSFTWE